MACSVATGKDYHDRRSKEGLVLYLAGEGHRGLSRRLLAWEMVNDTKLKNSKLHYSERGVQILDDLDAEMMRNEALTIQDTYGEPPKLVIVDTLARNFGPGNENSTEDMNRWIANIDRFIREEFRCCVVLVHHTGHGHLARGRGSSVLPAALDWEYSVSKNDEELEWSLDLEQTLVKDGRPFTPMRFLFQETEFHHLLDEDGLPTTSGALVTGFYEKIKKENKLFPKQQELMDAFYSVYNRKLEETKQNDTNADDVFVTQEELRERCNFDISDQKKAMLRDKRLIEVRPDKFIPPKKKVFV